MLPTKLSHRVKKIGAWTLFWVSPLLFVLVAGLTLSGQMAAAAPYTPQPMAAKSAANPAATATPTPVAGQLETSAESPTQWFVFLPILFKGPAYPTPVHSIAKIFGPVLNPGSAIASLASDEVSIQFGPTLDPPPPATPTSDVPTVIPGSPTYTPTPKITLTPTSTSTATPEIIPDGDFDSEIARLNWREFSLKEYPLFFDDKSSVPPHISGGSFSPDWAVWLGGDDNEISYIEGQVTVPTNRNYVGHVIKLQSYDTLCASSKYNDLTLAGHLRYANANTLNAFGVDIGGMLICENFPGRAGCGSADAVRVLVTGYDLCNIPDATSWGIFIVPLFGPGYDFRGTTVTLQIKALTDAQLSSSVFVDDVIWLDGPPTTTITGLDIQSAGLQTLQPMLVSDPAVFEAAGLPIPPEKVTLSSANTDNTYRKSR